MNGFDEKSLHQLPRLSTRLMFDTAERSLTEGVRRRDVTNRHLLYEAQGLCLDLRIEREPRGSRLAVVGQLIDRENPLLPVPPAPVFALIGDEVLADTRTNHLGEFILEIEPRPEMTLGVAVDGGGLIEVPLDRRMMARSEEQ